MKTQTKKSVASDVVAGQKIKCYDNGGDTFDRFTVVYLEQPSYTYSSYGVKEATLTARQMSGEPKAPNGYCCLVDLPKNHNCQLGKRVSFLTLPKQCQEIVVSDIMQFNRNAAAIAKPYVRDDSPAIAF